MDVSAIKKVLLKHQQIYLKIPRSFHQRCSMKKGVLRNFTKFAEKHLCLSLLFNKFAGPATLLKKDLRPRTCKMACKIKPKAFNFVKKETLAQVFSCEFCEISKNNFFTEHFWTTASEYLQQVRCRFSAWNFPVISFSKIFSIRNTYFQEQLRVLFIRFSFLFFLTAMCQARIYSLCFYLFLQKIRCPVLFSTS